MDTNEIEEIRYTLKRIAESLESIDNTLLEGIKYLGKIIEEK